MRNFEQMKRRFFITLGVLLVIDVALVAYLLWPGRSVSARRIQEEALQQQLHTLSREVAPIRGMDQKLGQTRDDVKELYQDRIPSHWSQISSRLEKLSQEAGIATGEVRYSASKQGDKGDLPDVQRVQIETSVKGEYARVAKFINAIEQDKTFFIIKQISLASQQGGTVTLQIKVETFLKEAA